MREALFTSGRSRAGCQILVLLLLLQIIITFYRKDLRVGTAFWSAGSLTLDFGGAQKNTSVMVNGGSGVLFLNTIFDYF